ncbi:MAG: MaoC family dehydratase [Anaerolineae bacterium]
MTKATELSFETLGEDFQIESKPRTITARDIETFAELSGDRHPLHLDEAYAATTPYGTRIAHGALILAIATGLAQDGMPQAGILEAFTQLRWKFQAPVRIGDTIRVRVTFGRKHSVPGYQGGLVTFDVQVLNQDDEMVQSGIWTAMVRG